MKRTRVGWIVALAVAGSAPAYAIDETVMVPLGGVREVSIRGGINSLSLGNPEVAEISGSGSTALIKGRKIGSSQMMVWTRAGRTATYLVLVTADVEALTAAAGELFPSEEISIQASAETLILRGTVSSLDTMDAIQRWVKGYKMSLGAAGVSLNILNRLELPGPQQVQLEIRFAEVSRTGLRKLGVNIMGTYDGNIGGLFGPGSAVPTMGTARELPLDMPLPLDQTMGILFLADPSLQFPFNALLSALNARGVSRSLSEPTAVALSGQSASVLVGGEFPVPIPLGVGQVSIEYKKYGIILDFTPVVLSDRTIQLRMHSEVSDIDRSETTEISGWRVPSLITRSTETTVRLQSGQSFAVAGLLSDRMTSTVHHVPVLGQLPIVGMLFRRNDFRRIEVELVVVITARLVDPVDAAGVPPLPGEGQISDPSDLELFLMGWEDVAKRDPHFRAGGGGRPVGQVGFRE